MPGSRTASTCRPETARGTHAFRVVGYSLLRGIGVGKFIRSAAFAVGGHSWCIRFYPDGDTSVDDFVFCVELLSTNAKVRARADFKLINPESGPSLFYPDKEPPIVYDTTGATSKDPCGTLFESERSKYIYEASQYFCDDCVLLLSVTLLLLRKLGWRRILCLQWPHVHMPPSDLAGSLGKLLEGKKGADVTFKVKDEFFPAHKIVLAMRSRVFDAQFYGPMGGSVSKCIVVEDMEPDVFRALLHFIYTDSMPAVDGLDAADTREIIQHLLVAADRYDVERLKLICEDILGQSLDVDNVANTLAVADQHHCCNLRDVCVKFITSSDRIGDVVASQGYSHLKRACPTALVDMLETVAKNRKINMIIWNTDV